MTNTGIWFKDVCRIGQKAACCKYLMADENGLFCGKLDPQTANWVDSRTDMTAQGDNCDGIPSKYHWTKEGELV